MAEINTENSTSKQQKGDFGGKLLVSASAGTGKTTTMIRRIAELIEGGVDVSQLAVVTFTNLAAAEMKKRLASKLAEKQENSRIVEQIERLDNASISTLHSFCNELLRNYFYVVDVDPAFAILDDLTVATLKKQALNDVFYQYLQDGDQEFWKIYQIFATRRREENFHDTILQLYAFANCLEDFYGWYNDKVKNFQNATDNNPVINTILKDICDTVDYCVQQLDQLATHARQVGLDCFAEAFEANVKQLQNVSKTNLQEAMFAVSKLSLFTLPDRDKKKSFGADKATEENVREDFAVIRDEWDTLHKKYDKLCRGLTFDQLWAETQQATQITDKLVEVLSRFEERYFALKKQRGGVDFNDLEHLTLQLFNDPECAQAIASRYKYVFVDEYQDINQVQEALIVKLAQNADLFMVGDVKQSIYGFRGCDSSIFLSKYQCYKKGVEGRLEELNTNYRTNYEILHFVNQVFSAVMTLDFGDVDYLNTAQLNGEKPPRLNTPSVQIDLVIKPEKTSSEIDEIYDITKENEEKSYATQGEVIAEKIRHYVGMTYEIEDANGEKVQKTIGYGDVVILMRSLKKKAVDIYNTLVKCNIPVVANFKTVGYANKEVRDIITLLRVIDNPFYDIPMVGLCLSPIGGMDESQLAQIKIATQDRSGIPFYARMQLYVDRHTESDLTEKITALLQLVAKLRFYSYGATVDELVLKVLAETDFHLYVQGLPNGGMRLSSLYAFIDSLKGASYAQSVDKFLSYLDETESEKSDECIESPDAVKIMTMHASKGLEFPVVILAGLKNGIKTDSYTVERNAQLGIATKFYNFETMRMAKTLGTTACGMFNHKKHLEEEMRLLYVAMTRAQYVLDMVGTISATQVENTVIKKPTSATCHLDWVVMTLQQKYGTVKNAVINGTEQIALYEVTGDGTQKDDLPQLCAQYPPEDKQKVLSALDWPYPYAAQINMPTKIVSSALDREYLDVDDARADFLLCDNADRNFVGTAYHKVYQYVNYDATIEQIRETIDFLVNNCKIERQYAEQLDVNLIYDTLNNAELRKLLMLGKVYHEMPFMLYAPYDQIAVDKRFSDDVMLQGVIDLLVLGKDSAVVIDFKYTSHSNLIEQRYKAQLNSYRLAVQKICGISNVKCYVLSVADNKLIEMN